MALTMMDNVWDIYNDTSTNDTKNNDNSDRSYATNACTRVTS